MLIDFFLKLKSHKLPVSIKEYLTLLEAMGKDVIGPSIDEFYYLSRAALVKDEANFDKFDRAFGEFWQGVETIPGIESEIPLEWLLKQVELHLTEEQKKEIAALGGWEKLKEKVRQRLGGAERPHPGAETSGSPATSTIRSSWARGTSRLRCAGFASSRARARRRSSIWRTPSPP